MEIQRFNRLTDLATSLTAEGLAHHIARLEDTIAALKDERRIVLNALRFSHATLAPVAGADALAGGGLVAKPEAVAAIDEAVSVMEAALDKVPSMSASIKDAIRRTS